MKLRDLIDTLEEIADYNEGEDVEVRFASQPSWPFEYSIDEIVYMDEVGDYGDTTGKMTVYLSEGTQLGYLPGKVSEILGWS